MLTACALFVFAAIVGGAGSAPQASSAGYAGEAACLSCHDTHGYQATAHARADNPRTPAAKLGCESCHGPGKAHADGGDVNAIRNPASLPVKEGTAVCVACHERVAHPSGEAAATGDSCVGCHSIHHSTAAKLLKKR